MWLRNFKEPEGQLARWLEWLEGFQFEVVHRKGKVHCNADAMSRIPGYQLNNAHVTVVLPAVVVKGRSQEDIKNCELVGPIYQAKLEGIRPSEQSVKERTPNTIDWCRYGTNWLSRMVCCGGCLRFYWPGILMM